VYCYAGGWVDDGVDIATCVGVGVVDSVCTVGSWVAYDGVVVVCCW